MFIAEMYKMPENFSYIYRSYDVKGTLDRKLVDKRL